MEQSSSATIGNRYSRFYTAYTEGGGDVTKVQKPWVIISGGHTYTSGAVGSGGSTPYYNAYKPLIDAELARPPEAEVTATGRREGNQLKFDVVVKNLSTVTLSTTNKATVTVIIYEDTDVGLTSRYDRAVYSKSISPALNVGETGTYSLETSSLSGVNWDKLHAVAVVEYRPGITTGPYDQLQADIAPLTSLSVNTNNLAFLIDSFAPEDKTATINLSGLPTTLIWNASTDQGWLTVDPKTGTLGTSGMSTQVHVDSDALSDGTNTGTITFTAMTSGKTYSQEVSVQVSMSKVFNTFLPVIER